MDEFRAAEKAAETKQKVRAFHDALRSRSLRFGLMPFLVIVLPMMFWTLWMARTFSGFNNPESMDVAQIARHLHRGDGFQTSVIIPLALAANPSMVDAPMFHHSPLYPLIQGVVFAVTEPSERMAALTSGFCWLLCMIAAFVLARREMGRRPSLVVLVFLAANTVLLRYSSAGLPHLLAAALFTGLWLILSRVFPRMAPPPDAEPVFPPAGDAPDDPEPEPASSLLSYNPRGRAAPPLKEQQKAREEMQRHREEAPAPPPLPRMALRLPLCCGLVAGALFLADSSFTLPVTAVLTALFLFWPTRLPGVHRVSLRPALVFLLGVLVISLPWMVRNQMAAGNPWYSLGIYEVMTDSEEYRGLSLYRTTTPPSWGSLLAHTLAAPFNMVKLGQHLTDFPAEAAQIMNPVVFFLVFPAVLVARGARRREWICLGAIALLLVWQQGVTSGRMERMLVLVPVLTVLTVQELLGVLQPKGPMPPLRVVLHAVRKHEGKVGFWRTVKLAARKYRRSLALTLLLFFAFSPTVSAYRDGKVPVLNPTPNVELIQRQATGDKVVMTDAPWLVAWYADVPALWMLQHEREFLELAQREEQPVGWIFFSNQRTVLPDEAVASWWLKPLMSRSTYENFRVSTSLSRQERLLQHASL